jgi:ribonuclease G
MATNLAAAAAIAREVRLRQIGGGINVDFAALDGRGPRERVRQALIEALAGDPVQPQVLGWTRLGHLEIVRPRRLRPLSDAMLEPGVAVQSAETLAFEALRLLAREARTNPAANWQLLARADVAARLALAPALASALRSLEERLGRKIAVVMRPENQNRPFDIVPL